METAIRWSQNCTPSNRRFLHVDGAGRSLKLCRADRIADKGFQYHTLSEITKVPHFRAFDWSPQDEALVALGQPSGEVTVVNIQNRTQETFSLPLKNQRQCNAVAISAKGLLAIGLDKVRSDFSLNIWDLNHHSVPSPIQSPASAGPTVEPYCKLAHSEPITSIKFFRDQPNLVVAGVKGQWVRIYDLRDGHGNAALQFATRCVHNVAIDPLDENYLASCAPVNDATICVWDRRSGTGENSNLGYTSSSQTATGHAVLELKKITDAQGMIWSLRFSKTKRGCLGMMASTGHLKVFDMIKDDVSDSATEMLYVNQVQEIHRPHYDANYGRGEKERVVCFDFMNEDAPNGEPQMLAGSADGKLSTIALNAAGGPLAFSPKADFVRSLADRPGVIELESPTSYPSSDVASILSGIQTRINSQKEYFRTAKPFLKQRSDVENQILDMHGNALLASSLRSRQRCLAGYRLSPSKNRSLLAESPDLQQLWTWIEYARSASDAGAMTYNRLDLSYLGVHALWMDDVGPSPLQKRRVGQLSVGAPPISKTIEGLSKQSDFPPQKLCSTNFPANRRICLRVSGSALDPTELERKMEELERSNQHTKAAFIALLSSLTKRAAMVLRGNKQNQAQSQTNKMLAMAIAGMAQRQRKQHAQQKSPTRHESESSESDSESWTSTIDSMKTNIQDPYALAILSYTLSGSWSTVLSESQVPLKYRISAALRWLPDRELTEFISRQTREAVELGNIEGIVLTGLGTTPAVQLMENYIRRSGDVQTAVLSLAHAVPRYLDDQVAVDKYEAWREAYRQAMNAWDLKFERVKFDIDSSKLATSVNGMPAAKPHKQLSIVCEYCSQSIAHHPRPQDSLPARGENGLEGPSWHRTQRHPLAPEKAAATGTVCPKCGRHLPRCGVCDLWLGMPDPTYLKHGAETYASNKKAKETNGDTEHITNDEKMDGNAESSDIVGQYQKQKQRQRHMEEMMANFVTFCIHCNHGFHASHALEWFGPRSSFAAGNHTNGGLTGDSGRQQVRRRVCPVTECDCVCDRA